MRFRMFVNLLDEHTHRKPVEKLILTVPAVGARFSRSGRAVSTWARCFQTPRSLWWETPWCQDRNKNLIPEPEQRSDRFPSSVELSRHSPVLSSCPSCSTTGLSRGACDGTAVRSLTLSLSLSEKYSTAQIKADSWFHECWWEGLTVTEASSGDAMINNDKLGLFP